jgi:cell division protease FtsH
VNSTVKTIMFWAFIVICLVLLFSVVQKSTVMGGKDPEIPFSTFLEKVQQSQVSDVTVQGIEVGSS